jgi:hypothetical protein
MQRRSPTIKQSHLFISFVCSFGAYLWKMVKDLLQHHSRPKNKEEMRQTVQGVWDQVSLEQLQMLISSMPNRMQQIISTKGGSTRW